MTDKTIDVFGVGNALVDILAQVDDEFIAEVGLEKGGMTLMDTDRQNDILNRLKGQELRLASGGSAANTMVAIAQSGGSGAYMGKVKADEHGGFYKKDLEEVGVGFDVPAAGEDSVPTGTSIILTTPDAERTMCTHLGVSSMLTKGDLDLGQLEKSKCCYVEGYLWTGESTREASLETLEQAKKRGVQTSFTFSDPFLVDLFKDDFRDLVEKYCDIVFCNADEARKFFGLDEVRDCASELGKICSLGFLTDGGNGCYVVNDTQVEHVGGYAVNAVDTVGAGDAFAGGVLYGITHGYNPIESAQWGNYFASRVVEKFGPRIEGCMKEQLQTVLS